MVYKNIYILFFIFITNCGYYSYKGSIPAGINSIAVSAITNNTSEFSFSNLINNKLSQLVVKDNIVDIVDLSEADSKLDITLKNIKESPEIYSVSDISSNKIFSVDQWKMEVSLDITWINLKTGEILLNKSFKKWAMYNTSDLDMKNDKIDNDMDGLLDGEDSDEYGAPREGAIRIISEKISNQIITELISTW